MIIALAGNKADLKDRRKVDADEAREYAASVNSFYLETSAKDALNVEKIFVEIAKKVPKQTAAPKKDIVPLRQPPQMAQASQKSGCCS